MLSAWRTLDFADFNGSLKSIRGAIRVEDLDGELIQDVPLKDVAVVVIGFQTQVSGAVLEKFSRYDIAVLVCDWRGVPVTAAMPWSETSRVAARIQAQSSLSLPRKKKAWKILVQKKILGQAGNLSGIDSRHLIELSRAVRSGDTTNIEAQAARFYWTHVFAGKTPGFARAQEGSDAVNTLLNYGYTILRGRVIRAIAQAGLSPTLGVFHRSRANYFVLADDLIEPFRPVVDWIVGAMPVDASLEDKEIKRQLVHLLDLPFNSDGTTVPAAIDLLAYNFAQYVEGKRDDIPLECWRPVG